jgi:DsbC/DsbD-like thiol-disulfide interchange protein
VRSRIRLAHFIAFAGALLLPLTAAAQIQLGGLDRNSEVKKQHVELLTDFVQLAANKPQEIELRFRVEPGFHINSHTPKDELLIPTALMLDPASGLHAKVQTYPSGSAFRLPVGEGETLDVYQGEFRVQLQIQAAAGMSTLTGTLHYQACDNAACFPPRTLPVRIAVTAK